MPFGAPANTKEMDYNEMLAYAQQVAAQARRVSDWCYSHQQHSDFKGHIRKLDRLAQASGEFANAVSRTAEF